MGVSMMSESSKKIRNVFNRWSAFNISNRCDLDDQRKVKSNKRIFGVFLIILLVTTPLLITVLWYSTESTLVFHNDNAVAGMRTGLVLTPNQYPTTPIAVYDNGTTYYAGANNISVAYVRMIGFVIIDPVFFAKVRGNSSLMISLMLAFVVLSQTTSGGFGSASGINLVASYPIYPFLKQYSTLFVYGNTQNNSYTHDIRFKIAAGSFIIPFFELRIQVVNLRDYPDHPNQWKDLSLGGAWRTAFLTNRSISDCQANHGSWEIKVTSLIYHSDSAFYFAKSDLSKMFRDNGTFPVEFEGSLQQNWWDLGAFFTPVTQYSTTTMSSFV